ncbi:MAG: hypothetical protein WD205_10500 [Rhodothermales bacterium]
MLWLVILPVVHAACAVQPRMVAAVCNQETDDHDHPGEVDASAHGMHHDASGNEMRHGMHHEASESATGDASQPNLSCCVFESPVFDRPATPVKFAYEEAGVVPVATTALVAEAIVRPPTVRIPISRVGSPPLPPLSPAPLSVFLI